MAGRLQAEVKVKKKKSFLTVKPVTPQSEHVGQVGKTPG
jgi:hypothetical protein